MEVFEAIARRRSVRAYRDEPVPRESLLRILEAVRLAPSWKDRQCWHVIVLSDRKKLIELGELLRHNPGAEVYRTVPYFLIFTADPARSGERDGKSYYMTDIGIAMQNAVLAATELGLGTCWIGAFDEAPIKALLGIPEDQRVVAMTPLGVPDESPDARPRKPLEEICSEGAWDTPINRSI